VSGPVLVVDDDPAIREAVRDVLEAAGMRVATARDGAEALERVLAEPPSLVLLDMRMPVMDGWHFSRALRERGLALPVVVMTAAADARRRAEEIAGGSEMTIDKIVSARAGVFQITAPFSTEVSDYGVHDTSTRKKEITVTVHATFSVE
jgi:CheY-like chemotaxis protein